MSLRGKQQRNKKHSQKQKNKQAQMQQRQPATAPNVLWLNYSKEIVAIAAAVAAALLLAVTLHSSSLVWFTPLTTQQIQQDLIQRLTLRQPSDAVAPYFKQTHDHSSGAAALAYLLTRFGDIVYESDVPINLSQQLGISPESLVIAAQALDYQLAIQPVAFNQLPRNDDQPVIAIMQGHRYRVIHHAEGEGEPLLVFDPGLGAIVFVDQAEFIGQWTGRVLALQMRPSVLQAR